MDIVDEEDYREMLAETGGGRVTSLKIRMHLESNQQEQVISIT